MNARIIRSQITDRGIEVEWSDDFTFVFDPDDMSQPDRRYKWRAWHGTVEGSREIARREAVSYASARQTLSGCGVQKVSK